MMSLLRKEAVRHSKEDQIPLPFATWTIVVSLLEILSFATSHYVIGMQLVIVCNYLDHVCNYKFGIV